MRIRLVLREYRVYDGFQGYGSEWMPVAGRGASLTLYPWDLSGGRGFGFRYHGIDIYPSDLAGSGIV